MTTTIGNVPPATTGITVTARHKAFFLGLPKVELHCHLLGTVRQETFEALIDKHRAPLSRADVAGFYRRDGKPIGVLRVLRALESHLLLEPDDFHRLTYEYLEDAARESVRHAEFFWNPTATVRDIGLPYAEVQAAIVRGMSDAQADFGIRSLLIPAIDREANPADANEMVRLMIANRHEAVAGIGIDYRENERPPELFREAYRMAKAAGLRLTAHAGEFGTPWKNVATVVEECRWIGSITGTPSSIVPSLVQRCMELGLVFTIVPTNSYYLRTLDSERWALDHPIRRMAGSGLKVHPNTDDPALHKVTPAGAWELMFSHFGYGPNELRTMMLNGVDGSWAEEGLKRAWRTQWAAEFDGLAASAF